MKNNSRKGVFSIDINRNTLKILMVMKLTTFFFLISIMSVTARGYSQHARLNLSLQNASIQELFLEIEKQSEFNFFYKDDQIDVNKMVRIEADNSLIGEVLNEVFKNSGVSYTVVNKVIVITPKKVQQNMQVTGTIRSAATGEILPGVNILVKGTETGTITGMDGTYSIEAPDANSVLVFSYIGYITQEIGISGRSVVDVILEESLEALDEVIVIGYGTQKKVNLTGSVSSVNLDKVEYRPVTELSQVLSGATSGITVIQTDAQPGSDAATIYIRGLNTLNNSTPLIVVDGIVGNLYDVHPSDVETISILKDASASAIYGARAANGVILITTKRGKAGKLTINYDYYYGIQEASRLPEVVSNSATYMELLNEHKVNAGKQPFYSDATIEEWRNGNDPVLYANTDWMDLLLGNSATMQSHSFSINGGSEPARYRISFNYLDQDGIIDKTNTDQYTFRTNFDSKVSERLNIGLNMSGKWRERQQPGRNMDIAFRGLSTNPMVLPQHPDGRYGGAQTPEDGNVWNVRKEIDTSNELLETQNFMGKVFASFEILDGLVLQGNAALDYQNWKRKNYETTWEVWNFHTEEIDQTSQDMWLEDFQARDRTITLFTTLAYTKTLAEKHNLHLLAGYSQEEYRTDNLSGYISQFANNELFTLDAGLDVESQSNSGTAAEWALQSYFGRFNYNYEGRYLLEANLRYDGSSRFAPENRWGFFPSFSAGWRVSEESFMQDLDMINNFKIRASWGEIGNNAIGNYRYLSLYDFNRNYVFDNSVIPGVAVGRMANHDIMWETTITTDFGLDIGILKNMFELSGDYFIKRTEDILITVPIPYLIGDLGAPIQNVGTVENRGWELSMTHRNSIKDFNYTINFNISHVENKVIKYSDVDAISGGFLLREGLPVWSLYGYNSLVIFQNQEEVDGHAFQNPMTGPGDLKFEDQLTVDTNGDGIPDEADGVIDGDDRVVLGNPFPEYYYGLNLSLSYKGIDLSVLFQGVSKQDGYLRSDYLITPFFSPDRGIFITKWLDRWTPENPDTDVPRLNENNLSGSYNSYWVQDNSYLRLKNLQLGYSLPESLTRKISVENIRIYANAQNLFVHTDFEGFDPERGLRQTGVGYPLHRTYTFGIGITF